MLNISYIHSAYYSPYLVSLSSNEIPAKIRNENKKTSFAHCQMTNMWSEGSEATQKKTESGQVVNQDTCNKPNNSQADERKNLHK